MNISTNISLTTTTPTVTSLDGIAGLDYLKSALNSLITLPRTQPQVYKYHKFRPTSVLLYGPPGTGKTKLVHALAAHSDALLQSITPSDIISAYVGETERNIKAVFELVKNNEQFSILFIDELDGFCRKRTTDEKEYSRRLKTELMCQMSSLEDHGNIVIAATNRPWDIDSAILRRFSRRYYVPLPDKSERLKLLHFFTQNIPIEDANYEFWDNLSSGTDGYSGSDLLDLVQQALEVPIMELQDRNMWLNDDGMYKPIDEQHVINATDIKKIKICPVESLPFGTVQARHVHAQDFYRAAFRAKRTISIQEIEMFEAFEKEK